MGFTLSPRVVNCRSLVLALAVSATAAICAAPDAATTASMYQDVMPLISDEKFDEAKALLDRWQKQSPDDADLAAARANYLLAVPEASSHLTFNYTGATTETQATPQDGGFALLDAETSEPVGHIGEAFGPERDKNLAEALRLLNAASAKHPNRLDIRLGAIELYKRSEQFDTGFPVLSKLVDETSKTGYANLLWMENKPAKEPRKTLSDTVHRYYTDYISTEEPDDALAIKIAQLGTATFPKDLRHWNNLAAEHFQKGDPDKALESFGKAHSIDPKDCIVIMNIAHIYTKTDRPDKAIAEYEKVIKIDNNDDLVEAARESIKELKATKKPK